MTPLGPPEGEPDHRSLAKRTFILECVRAVPAGYMEACISSLFLLIALQGLHADSGTKALIAAAGNGGMLLTPLTLRITQRSRRPATAIASLILASGALALAMTALVGGLVAYTVGTVIGMASVNIVVPLLTTVYQRNYGSHERGRNVSLALMIRMAMSALAAWLLGRWLDTNLASYRWVVTGAAVALMASATVVSRLESSPIPDDRRRRLVDSFALMRQDRVLATTMASWMFMGMANLTMIPLRTEYLGNPDYGIDASPSRIALLIVAVPSIVRVLMSPVFGWVFDRMSFFGTRIALNVGFGISILAFFTGSSLVGLIIGSVTYGIAAAGGDVLWQLWAIKLAPPAQVADYMALHTFFTGVRGAVAPFLAYWLVAHFAVRTVGFMSALMIVVGTLILWPDLRAERARRALAAGVA